ncbi:hypothetical protein, partial [Limosilactobacillus reuteri]|uniref:hypothetical protein n=1 Tax=Limosilactobacillus reuteri TaxID=1598 RepID=UPI001CDA7E90
AHTHLSKKTPRPTKKTQRKKKKNGFNHNHPFNNDYVFTPFFFVVVTLLFVNKPRGRGGGVVVFFGFLKKNIKK